ncbi:MAG: serine hydrolase domain-containing protein, partial [Bacteroidota bacterium]
MRSILILLMISFGLGPIGFAQESRVIDHLLDSLMNDYSVPSLALAIYKDGDVVYEKALGYSDRERQIKASIHTPYQLASLSKPITATAIMQLQEKKRINIDEPFTDYSSLPLKKAQSHFETPSIRQLLNHTSGLGTYFDIYYADEERAFTNFETSWGRYGQLFQAPGRVCEYSNLGYGLLGNIISQESGQAFEDYLEAKIFKPLGMDNAQLIFADGSNQKQIAQKYDHQWQPLPFVNNNTPGAGNIAASIRDVIRFAAFHLGQLPETKVLEKASILEMQQFRDPKALYHYYENTYYGLGWYVRPDDQGKYVVWHEGGMMGASSMLKMFPRENLAIAILTNCYHPSLVRDLTDRLSALMLEAYKPSPLQEMAEYLPVSSDPHFLGLWQGVMNIEGQEIPVSLMIGKEDVQIRYLDIQAKSFLTDYQALPYQTTLLFGAVNQNYFIGTGIATLPASHLREGLRHLFSLKLLKQGRRLRGTIIHMAAAEREYYAYPY